MPTVRQQFQSPAARRVQRKARAEASIKLVADALKAASVKPAKGGSKYVRAPKPKAPSYGLGQQRRQDRAIRRNFNTVLKEITAGRADSRRAERARQRVIDLGGAKGVTSAQKFDEQRRLTRIVESRPKRRYKGDEVLQKGLAAAGRALDDALPNPARSTVNLGKGQTARAVAGAGGRVKTGGIPETKIPRSGAAAALVAAENLTRISSAGGKGATEAIKAIQRGKSAKEVGKAYVRGQAKGFVENRSSYGDALRQVGASKGASAGIGFVLDVVLDPTTYLTLGIPAAGRAAARAAGEAAGRAAVKRGASKAVALREIRAAMRGEAAVVSPGATRPRGNIAGRMRSRARALESEPESPAITRQRRQLRDLEQSGRGRSRKAQNIRKNLDRAGKRKASRVERAEGTAARVQRRADDAASVVTPSGRVKTKAPRSTRLFPSKGSQRARVRNMLRPARTEAKTKFSRMAERQVENSAKGQRTDPVLSVRFAGRRVADVPLQPLSKGAVKNSGKVGITAREVVGDVAPGIRSDRGLSDAAQAGARQASRDERSGRGTAEVNAVLNMKAVRTATGRIDDADRDLWVAVWERSGDPATRVRVRDGRFVFGADDVLQDLPDDFARRYLVKTRRRGYQLRGTKRVNDVLKGARRKVERSGQPVGDALKIGQDWSRKPGNLAKTKIGDRVDGRRVVAESDDVPVANTDSIAASLDEPYKVLDGIREVPTAGWKLGSYRAKESKALAAQIKQSGEITPLIVVVADDGPYILEGSTRIDALLRLRAKSFPAVVVDARTAPPEELASRYYPRRAAQDQDLPYQDKVDYIPPSREAQTVGAAAREQAGAAALGGSVRGNLMGRQDPRPQDVANLERFMGEGSGPIMGANPAQDFAQYGLNMERIAAYNAGVRRLAESGQSVRMKPAGEETLEEFYTRNGIMNGEPESVGMKVYELGVRGEGAGRYDLREIEPEVLQQLVTGKAPGGEATKLKRVGQYVILDERAVARFRQFRSAEVLGNKPLTRLWDRLGGRLRQLAIFTPMYQAINEMGDTWIMFTVVPGYKIPVYKTKALPIVRYLQAAEAGNRRLTRELGDAEILVGGKFMKVKDVARLTRAEGVARQGVFAKTVDITNPEVRQVTKRRKPGRIRDAAADKLAGSDPYVQFLATAPKRGAQSTGRFFRSREDWSRVATWLYFMDEGYTSDRAVADSLEALIDYGELSRAERNVLRRFAFFYTFPARQIPYQTKALFRRPGKLAAYEKLRVAAADYQNIDLSDLYEQPWYVQANVPIPLRVGGEVRWVSANLPFNMLNQTLPIGSNWPVFGSGGLAERDLDFILSSFNPLLRVPAEDITNRNFFFRSQIESESGMSANETPAPWYIVQLAKASPALQRKLGVYYKETRTSQGRKIWLMDKKWAWRLSQLSYGPVRVPAEAGKFRNERGQSFMDQMFRFTTGIRVDRDKSIERRTSEIFDRQSEIREQLSKMRGDSRFEGKARWMKLQAEQKRLEAELKKLGTEVGLSWGWGEQRPKGKSGGSLLDRLGPGRGNPNYTGPGAGSGESLLERLK